MPKPKWARRARSVAVGLLAGLLVVLLYTLYLLRTADPATPAFTPPPPVRAPAFSLLDQEGAPFGDGDLLGKVWIAELTFAGCPDCPVGTEQMARLRDRLREQGLLGAHVVLVSFSGHPLANPPETLAPWAATHGARPDEWRFLTGDPSYLEAYVGADFFLPVDVVEPEVFGEDPPPYPLVRSNRFVLVDRRGEVRNYYAAHRLADEGEMQLLLEEIRQLLLEG